MTCYDEALQGSKCVDVFLQPTAGTIFATDTFVVNLVKERSFFSFHSFAMARLIHQGKIVYTITDHYLNCNGTAWRNGQRKLSSQTYPNLRKLVVGRQVSRFLHKTWGDIVIEFDNGAVLEFIIDASPNRGHPEVHRLIIKKDIDSAAYPEHYVFER